MECGCKLVRVRVYKWVYKRLKCRRRLACVSKEYHELNRKDFGSTNFCSSMYKWIYFKIMGKFDYEIMIAYLKNFA